jgi:hypothetical protein
MLVVAPPEDVAVRGDGETVPPTDRLRGETMRQRGRARARAFFTKICWDFKISIRDQFSTVMMGGSTEIKGVDVDVSGP